jgi:NhaA family Na+:H+ antiporter
MAKLAGKEYLAPWEKAFDHILTPLEEFIHRQTTSGVLLMICAVVALVIANGPWAEGFHHLLETKSTWGTPNWNVTMSIHHWINDGLMALFFFVVGLELKRELLVGELSDLKQAMLPIIAAIGGMVLPALFYLAFNMSGPNMDGWGVPMATDIAFALGALALLGSRVPKSLLTFLVALAIVDDLGAVTVIAVFYTEKINLMALGASAGILLLLVALNLGGVRRTLPYVLLGILLWLELLASGVHATLAGILLAFTIPMQPKLDPERFIARSSGLLEKIKESFRSERNIIKNYQMRSQVTALGDGVILAQAPAQVLEHAMHIPSSYVIIPIFALANAAIPIDWSALGTTVADPVALGVVAGLVFGKLFGIAGFVWIAVKLGVSPLPQGLNFKHIIGVSLLGGIGFTMSIFIAELAFAHSADDLLMAKTGILAASLVAGVGGYLWLFFTADKSSEHSQPV